MSFAARRRARSAAGTAKNCAESIRLRATEEGYFGPDLLQTCAALDALAEAVEALVDANEELECGPGYPRRCGCGESSGPRAKTYCNNHAILCPMYEKGYRAP
jgi:hypothetical protein